MSVQEGEEGSNFAIQLQEQLRDALEEKAQLKEELSVVQAYIKLECDGRTVHEIIRDIETFDHKYRKLQDEFDKFKNYHKQLIAKEKEKNRMCRRLMREQQEKVVKPMVLEIAVKDELNKRFKTDFSAIKEAFKKLQTIVRVPVMCLQF